MLRQRFTDDLKDAMKAKSTDVTTTLRLIIAGLETADIDARGRGHPEGLTDTEILTLLQKMIKQRRESVQMYLQGNRPDLAAKEEAEIAIIGRYLPAMLEGPSLEAAIIKAITTTQAQTAKDMGKVMAHLKEHHAGTMDFSAVAPMIKKHLL